jgi:hypothetical protein
MKKETFQVKLISITFENESGIVQDLTDDFHSVAELTFEYKK